MISTTKEAYPGLYGVFTYDYWCIGNTETAKSVKSNKSIQVFCENEYTKYVRQLLYRLFCEKFLEDGQIIRIEQSVFGTLSEEDLLAVQEFFNQANKQVVWFLESQITKYSILKNEIKCKFYKDRLDFTKENDLKVHFFSSKVKGGSDVS
ncbi:MAG: hypothetical protein WCW13_05710 [archaeon]|jgi:hypothetical protein